MPYALLADLLLIVHLGFILFVVLGGLAVWRWPWLAWLHLPCLAWGVLVELMGWICPLTPWEVHFRTLAGQAGYQGDFIQHYLLAAIYPEGLTRGIQIGLGLFALGINLLVYLRLPRRLGRRPAHRSARRSPAQQAGAEVVRGQGPGG